MAINKKSSFKAEELILADFANAISHPARVAILKVVAERQSCICGEIVKILPLAQSTVSQHLKELKNAGLIDGSIDGVKSCYCINWQAFERIAHLFNDFFETTQLMKSKNDATCC